MKNKVFEFKFITDEELLEGSSGFITSMSTINGNGKIYEGGLFSQRIFGPIHNYRCACGNVQNYYNDGVRCPNCHVECASNTLRNKRYALIELVVPVINPLLAKLVSFIFKVHIVDTIINSPYIVVTKNDNGLYLIDGVRYNILFSQDKVESDLDIRIGTYGLKDLLDKIDFKDFIKKNYNDEIKYFLDNKIPLSNLISSYVFVTPPGMRNYTLISSQFMIKPGLNTYYLSILSKNNRLKDIKELLGTTDSINFWKEWGVIQSSVHGLYFGGFSINKVQVNGVSGLLGSKGGLVRGEMLGKSVAFTGRSVIVSGPKCNTINSEVIIPYDMIYDIFKPKILYHLQELTKKELDECLDIYYDDSSIVGDIIYEYIDNQVYCIINRQPTLHPGSVVGCCVRVNKDKSVKAIMLDPLITSQLNADHDGDTVQVIFPQTVDGIKELKEKLLITNNLNNFRDNSNQMTISQEQILGLWYLTDRATKTGDNKLVNLDKNGKSVGYNKIVNEFKHFNKVELLDGIDTFNKKNINKLLNRITRDTDLNNKQKAQIIMMLRDTGFKAISEIGFSLHWSEFFQDDIEFNSNVEFFESVNKKISDIKSSNSSFSALLNSGARGSANQIQQISIAKGASLDTHGNFTSIVNKPLSRGLTPDEYLSSVVGSRKGLIDRSISTGVSGYFTAKLAKGSRDLVISEDRCDSNDGIYLPWEKCEGRVLVEDVKVEDELILEKDTLINKSIIDYLHESKKLNSFVKEFNGKFKVRSPLTCTAKGGICKHCYGELVNKGKDPNIGDSVGLLSALVISEPAMQLTMKTFHNSSSFNAKLSKVISNKRQSINIEYLYSYIKISVNDLIYILDKGSVNIDKDKTDYDEGEIVFTYLKNDGDMSTKFPKLEKMVQLTQPRNEAVLATSSGVIKLLDIKETKEIKTEDNKRIITEELTAKIDIGGVEHYIDLLDKSLILPIGSYVEKGDVLTTGDINWGVMYNLVDENTFIYKYMEEMDNLFSSEGININNIHYEVLLTVLMSLYKDKETGELVNRTLIEDYSKYNKRLNSIMTVGKSGSLIQHMSLGYVTQALNNILTKYNKFGITKADRLVSGEL